MSVSAIPDSVVRAAIENASSGFTTGTVLHRPTGLATLPDWQIRGSMRKYQSYHLSLDAYIASPLVPAERHNGLPAGDGFDTGQPGVGAGTADRRGIPAFEIDWTVGNTGETSPKFFLSNQPAAYPDVYFGDFTVTAAKSASRRALKRTRSSPIPAEELFGMYTFDFTDDRLLETGVDGYAQLSALDDETAEKLRALGFGERIYYCNKNFMMKSISPDAPGRQSPCHHWDAYDTRGNLTTSDGRGAFVMLHMTGGVRDSAEVSYTVKRDPADSRHLDVDFLQHAACRDG